MKDETCVRWLRWACAATLVVGLTSSLASHPATAGPWLRLFDLLYWPLDGDPSGFTRTSFALNAVLGGVMAGWACLMYAVVDRRFAAGHFELAKPMLGSVIVWFVVDSAGSFVAGYPGNVVLNVVFALILAPPLIVLGRGPDD